METVLITGGSGFIGSNLAASLIDDYRVIVVDNFSTGNQENVKLLLKNPNFVLKNHNIQEPLDIDEPVSYVFHLASRASPVDYQKHPVDTMLTNALGTSRVLAFSERKGARFLLTSTSEVYGNPRVHPQTESYWGDVNPIGIRSCYDEGKRVAETLCFDYHREHEVDIRIVRIFNTYGPRMHPNDGRVVSNFIVQALQKKPVTIYGSGSQTRSFCYVDDLVDGLIKMMDAENFIGPVNLGNPVEITVKQLAKKIITMTGSQSEVIEKSLPKDDPARRKPDISLARKILQWNPRVSLEEGLEKTIQHLKERI